MPDRRSGGRRFWAKAPLFLFMRWLLVIWSATPEAGSFYGCRMVHGSLYFPTALLQRCWMGIAVVLGAVILGVLALLYG